MISIDNIKAILNTVSSKGKTGSESDDDVLTVLSNLPDVSNIEYNNELACFIFKLSRKVYRADIDLRGGFVIDEVSQLDLKLKKLKDLETEIKEFCEDNDESFNIELFDENIKWGEQWQSSSYDC